MQGVAGADNGTMAPGFFGFFGLESSLHTVEFMYFVQGTVPCTLGVVNGGYWGDFCRLVLFVVPCIGLTAYHCPTNKEHDQG